MSEYNSLKGQLGQINRKQGGSLAVRDIAGLVKEADVVNTEYLTTQFVVLSKFEKGSFEREYESLTEYVVGPLSAAQSAADVMRDLVVSLEGGRLGLCMPGHWDTDRDAFQQRRHLELPA